LDQVQNKSDGLSVFLVDLRASGGKGVTVAADPQHAEPRD